MKSSISLLYLLIFFESSVLASKSYLRLVGFGCDKLNIIQDDLLCPGEGNYSMAGTCESYVTCMKEKVKNREKTEPYVEFCDPGKNYVRGRCVPISDPYDCPQSHCKWIREGLHLDSPSTSELPVIAASNSNIADSKPNANGTSNIASGSSGQSDNFKCEEIPQVDFEHGTTCPSEGNFTYFENSEADCGLFIKCSCLDGYMGTATDACLENEIFNGNKCVENAEAAKSNTCPQKKCKLEQTMKKEYKNICPGSTADQSDSEFQNHDNHNHNNHQSTTTSRPKTNSSASLQILFMNPVYVILILIVNSCQLIFK